MTEEEQKQIAAQLRCPSGDPGVKVGEEMNKGNRAISLKAYELLDIQMGEHILEIGPGNAIFVQKNVLDVAKDVVYSAVDISDTMLAEAKTNNQAAISSGKASFHKGDIVALPFADASMDKICTANTLYFWSDAKQAVSELHRVLKPGGRLVIAIRPKKDMQEIPLTRFGFTIRGQEEVWQLLQTQDWSHSELFAMQDGEVEFGDMKKVISSEYYILKK